jgi:hypothetical protein
MQKRRSIYSKDSEQNSRGQYYHAPIKVGSAQNVADDHLIRI